MRVGIVTIIDYLNYGNRLQNYAVQEVLKSLGMSVETIHNSPGSYNKDTANNPTRKLIRQKNIISILRLIQAKVSYEISKRTLKKLKSNKAENFKKFTSELINESEFHINELEIPSGIDSLYDYFVVGSDQVWNPHHRRGYPIDFLCFATKEKRIAYAPSFGVSEIPSNYKLDYEQLIDNMEYLSVREEAGAKIIKDLTGREAEVLVDPTLMLDKSKWLEISKESMYKPQNGYVLTYFLGDQKRDITRKIKKYAKDNSLELINLANINDEKYYCIDPSEFIDFIHSSNIIFTDSFHGVVFSMLFEKPFVVFKRGKMNSRIDTLLKKFQLEGRKWENISNLQEAADIDYSHVSQLLNCERTKSYNYLKNALNIKDAK
jgi:hypothetical protein